ncbi:MAG TPA: 2'-5' RNA ligase family protein, partial [Candidatus Bathyarchaeia archaeon]|nr:2'-5' RNA ligase family protein [Candidatus Bathyarchaeia archaeon]
KNLEKTATLPGMEKAAENLEKKKAALDKVLPVAEEAPMIHGEEDLETLPEDFEKKIEELAVEPEIKGENITGYRSEEVSGEGHRDIKNVVRFETEELGNEDIIDTLIDKGIIKDKSELQPLIDNLEKQGFKEVVWLSDSPQDVVDVYSFEDRPITPESIERYDIEDGVVISDLGRDGKLVAYKPDKVSFEPETEISKPGTEPEVAEIIEPVLGKSEVTPVEEKPEVKTAEIDAAASEAATHDYSNTQVNLPEEPATAVKELGRKIPDEELYTEEGDDAYGREEEPHITVRYGLETSNPKDVEPAFENIGPIKAKIGKVSVFDGNDNYDVVVADVESDALVEANKKVGETVSVPGETFKEYKPHVTIAYVKKGEGKKYVGDKSLEGKEITVDSIFLSAKDGKMHEIKLKGQPEAIPEPLKPEKVAGAKPQKVVEPEKPKVDIIKDQQTEDHFKAWLDKTIVDDDRVSVETGIREFIKEHPDVIERGDSWPDIRRMAERNEFIKPTPAPEKTDVALEGAEVKTEPKKKLKAPPKKQTPTEVLEKSEIAQRAKEQYRGWKHAKPEIKVTGKEDKTVSVEMPKSKAEDLTPKEQKAYLLAEIDKAIETASDGTPQLFPKLSRWENGNMKAILEHQKEGSKIYSKNKSKFGTVTIEVPGDGEFTILNTKYSLSAFKKGMSQFPATEPKPKKSSVASTKPSGKRIIGEDVQYYNEFKPRKQGIIEREFNHKGDIGQYYKDGYFSDGSYIIKTGSKPKLKYKVETKNTPDMADILEGHKKAKPAIIRGEVLEGAGDKVSVHVESKDGAKHHIYNAKYFDSIWTVHPKAELKIDDSGIAYFMKGKDVVGVTMPFLASDKSGFEGLSLVAQEGYKKLYGEPKTEKKPHYQIGKSKTHEYFYVNLGNNIKSEVIKNPTDADYRALSKEFKKEFPKAPIGEPKTRYTYDREGNKYIWRS